MSLLNKIINKIQKLDANWIKETGHSNNNVNANVLVFLLSFFVCILCQIFIVKKFSFFFLFIVPVILMFFIMVLISLVNAIIESKMQKKLDSLQRR